MLTKTFLSGIITTVPLRKRRGTTTKDADVAELADALDSGSSEFTLMQVQVLLSAPYGRVPEWPKGADCKSVA